LGAAVASWGLDSAFSLRSRRVVPLGYFNNNFVAGGVPRANNPRSGRHAAASPRPRRPQEKSAPTAATVAKRADNKAAKGAAKAAVQAAQAAANGSALLAGLGVAPAATPQTPPQATASPAAANAVPAMASPAAAAPPTAAATPAAADPGQPAFERRADASPPDVVAELDDDAQLKDQDAGPGVQQVTKPTSCAKPLGRRVWAQRSHAGAQKAPRRA
jgi:hypothetical protein